MVRRNEAKARLKERIVILYSARYMVYRSDNEN